MESVTYMCIKSYAGYIFQHFFQCRSSEVLQAQMNLLCHPRITYTYTNKEEIITYAATPPNRPHQCILTHFNNCNFWTMTKKEEEALFIFERKIFRRIYVPKYEDAELKIRTNRELEELNKV